MIRKLLLGMGLVGLLCVPVTVAAAPHPATTSPELSVLPVSANPAPVSAIAAGRYAVKALGGGSVMRVSIDHYQGQSVYDIHILDGGHVWDVKVAVLNGRVLQQKLSSEQSGIRSTPETPSARTTGYPRSPQGRSTPEGSGSAMSHLTWDGIPLGQKITIVPPQFSSYVTQTITLVGGISLKWVRFQATDHGEYQMNVKIRLQQGTTKVKDLFNSSGQMLNTSNAS